MVEGLSERKLIVSFGANGEDLGKIAAVSSATWDEFAAILTRTPPETDDKASQGWYCPAEFNPRRRHSENFVARHALTLDYDVVTPAQIKRILAAFAEYEYVVYTTWSHTPEKPRLRVVMPLTRACSADEFCAVSRMVASIGGIEFAARESHTPPQFMFQPTRKPGAEHKARRHKGAWVDVDTHLGLYADWTDRSQWPHRKEHDEQYAPGDLPAPPTSKPGVIGAFCRAYDVPTAIDRFELPYKRVV